MAEIEKHIVELLHSRDKLTIPELGTLQVKNTTTEAHPIHHTFSPGKRVFEFSENPKQDTENELVSIVAFYDNSTIEQATQVVKNYVYDVRQRLKEAGSYSVKNLGKFKINNQNYNLEFEFDANADFSSFTFGLPEFEMKPTSSASDKSGLVGNETSNYAVNNQKKGLTSWLLVVLPMLVVSLLLIIYFNSGASKRVKSAIDKVKIVEDNGHGHHDDHGGHGGHDNHDDTKKEAEYKSGREARKAELLAEKQKNEAENKQTLITAEAKEDSIPMDFRIVAGAFASRENAKELADSLVIKGYKEVAVLDPPVGKRLFKVCVGYYVDRKVADEELKKFAEKEKKSWWVLPVEKKSKVETDKKKTKKK